MLHVSWFFLVRGDDLEYKAMTSELRPAASHICVVCKDTCLPERTSQIWITFGSITIISGAGFNVYEGFGQQGRPIVRVSSITQKSVSNI